MMETVSGTVSRTKPRGRPDPRPARLMVSAGAVAALAIIGAGLVRVPLPADAPVAPEPAAPRVRTRDQVGRRVRYVRLKPGQHAPPGAKVIQEAAPRPRVVVRLVGPTGPVAAPRAAAPVRRVVTRTRQSGV